LCDELIKLLVIYRDPQSDVEFNDICLGYTTRDCNEMNWERLSFNPNVTLTAKISPGIPVWVKVKAINHGMS
jgi:hypothetical protein